MTTKKYLTGILVGLALSGCSSTSTYHGAWSDWGKEFPISNKSQQIEISSMPPDASVFVGKDSLGKTPLKISLNYPVMGSERTRGKHQKVKPGVLEGLTGLKKTETFVIGSQKETMAMGDGSRCYDVDVKKKDYITKTANICVPNNNPKFYFGLEKKLNAKVENLPIKYDKNRSVLQYVYEQLFGKGWNNQISARKVDKEHLNPEALSEAFIITEKDEHYTVGGEVVVENKETTLSLYIKDKNKQPVASKSMAIPNKGLTRHGLYSSVNALTNSLVKSFLEKR